MNNNYSNTLEVMQGTNCQGRTLVVIFSAMSALSDSQGLTDFLTRGHPFYIKIVCALHHMEWLDNVIVTSQYSMFVIMTRLDDVT